MKVLLGALKSKTIWFGLAMTVVGCVSQFLEANLVPMLSNDPSSLWLVGPITILLRLVTKNAVADKVQ